MILILAFNTLASSSVHMAKQRSKNTRISTTTSRRLVFTDKRTSITPMRISSRSLVEVLNYGYVRELNSEFSHRDVELRLRLYAIPREGDTTMPGLAGSIRHMTEPGT